MGFFGFSETEGYGAQPYDGIAEAQSEEPGQVPTVPSPSPSPLSIIDELNYFQFKCG